MSCSERPVLLDSEFRLPPLQILQYTKHVNPWKQMGLLENPNRIEQFHHHASCSWLFYGETYSGRPVMIIIPLLI